MSKLLRKVNVDKVLDTTIKAGVVAWVVRLVFRGH